MVFEMHYTAYQSNLGVAKKCGAARIGEHLRRRRFAEDYGSRLRDRVVFVA